MLSENEQNERKFNLMLKKALKQHREPAQQEFVQRLIDKVQTIEQQKVLRRVIWQERMLLAACILLPIAGVILVLMFPNVLLVPVQLYKTIYLLAKETAANMVQQWQLWISYAAVMIVVMYGVHEVMLADN
jgi:uncharacterized membrane protein